MSLISIQLPQNSAPRVTGAFNYPANARRIHRTKFTLNSVPVALGGDFSWGYHSGVSPQQVSISMSANYIDEFVEQVNANRGEVEIFISSNNIDNNKTELEFKGLSLLPRSPNTHTHDFITLTDDRWRWPNKKIYGTFNLVRKVNDLHVFEGVTSAVRPTLNEAKRFYVPWTIIQDSEGNPVRPYKAIDIVIHVLTEFLGYEEDDIDTSKAATSNYIPPNIVLVGSPAHSVISRFLGESDNNLYIDESGKVHIYAEKIPFGQDEFDNELRPALRGKVTGDIWVQDRKAIRPTNIYVSMEQEFECLLSYVEQGEGVKTSSTNYAPAKNRKQAKQQIDNRRIFVECVTETIIDNQIGNLPRGTLVTIEDALEAFGNQYGGAPITFDDFRKYYGIDAPSVFGLVLRDPSNDVFFDGKAVTIWGQIVRDYRRRFRIPPSVTSYLKAANNVLVEIINPESGKRKPTEVFTTLSWVVRTETRVNKKRTQGIDLDSFDNLSESGRYGPAPVLLSDIDIELGTFEITGLADIQQPGAVTDIIMGRPVDEDAFFEDTFAEGETALAKNALTGAHGLTAEWEMSAVVSLVMLPQGPQTMRWFDPDPPDGVERGNGPHLEIHTNYDTARYSLDGAGLNSYRSGNGPVFTNQALAEAIADQESKRRWVTFADQLIGAVEFALSEEAKDLRPTGPVSNVKFTVSKDGNVRMGFSASPISEGRDIRNTLEQEQLEVVFKQVHFDVKKGTR